MTLHVPGLPAPARPFCARAQGGRDRGTVGAQPVLTATSPRPYGGNISTVMT